MESAVKSEKAQGNSYDDVSQVLNASNESLEPRSIFSKYYTILRSYCNGHQAYVWFLFISYVLCRSLDRIWFNRWMKEMQDYDWLNTALLFPIGVNFCMWVALFYYRVIKNSIPPHQRDVPQWKLFTVASMDAGNSIIAGFATPFLSVALQNVLNQSVLIFVMVSSFFFLKRRYLGCHYLGALLTVYGILVSVMQIFDGQGLTVETASNVVISVSATYIIIYIISVIPAASSYTWKESMLKAYDTDVYWFNAWIGLWQLIFGIITVPVVFIPMPSPAEVIPPAELGSYLEDGFMCFFGYTSASRPANTCRTPWLWWLLYSVFNLGFNILMTMLFKNASAVYAIIATGGVMIVSALMGTNGSLVGKSAQPITTPEAFALTIIAVSIVVYNYLPEKDVHGNDVVGAEDQTERLEKSLEQKRAKLGYPIDTRRRSSIVCI